MQERLEREEKERQERMEEKQRQEREQQRQFEREKEEQERQERLEQQRLEHELEMKKLELGVSGGSNHSVSGSSSNFEVTKYIKLVPPFQETDVDKYFLHFEKSSRKS